VAEPYLAAVAEAVEHGVPFPPITLSLTSGDLVKGQPRPSKEFADLSYHAVLGDVKPPQPASKERADRRRRLLAVVQLTNPTTVESLEAALPSKLRSKPIDCEWRRPVRVTIRAMAKRKKSRKRQTGRYMYVSDDVTPGRYTVVAHIFSVARRIVPVIAGVLIAEAILALMRKRRAKAFVKRSDEAIVDWAHMAHCREGRGRRRGRLVPLRCGYQCREAATSLLNGRVRGLSGSRLGRPA
jgi:hypothetical protein